MDHVSGESLVAVVAGEFPVVDLVFCFPGLCYVCGLFLDVSLATGCDDEVHVSPLT